MALSIVPIASCREETPHLEPPLGVRDVRVLILDAPDTARVRVAGPYEVIDADGNVVQAGSRLAWSQLSAADSEVVLDRKRWKAPIQLKPKRHGSISFGRLSDKRSEAGRFPGHLRLQAIGDRLRVINAVDVETYVAGVVANEVWPDFHDEALKAQAVAARGYVLYIMAERAARAFDVRASERDQVYRGLRDDTVGKRARAAVEATRGLVMAWSAPSGERAFCTYYASACGGMTQSLADVQSVTQLPDPLRGNVRCDFCAVAAGNEYRWQPTRIRKASLLDALRRRRNTFADWKSIRDVQVARWTSTGRIAEVQLLGDGGKSETLRAEPFRLAVGSRIMRSSACQIEIEGDELCFVDGRGFGHGLGLCQWGMEGQARAGRQAGHILRYYYPGGTVRRAY